MKQPYTPPTLRQLSRGDLTDEQAAWIESTMHPKKYDAFSLGVAAVLGGAAVLLAIAVVASLLSGCAAPIGDGPVYVDERFSSDEAAEIQRAADYWCDATAGAACVDLVFGARVDMAPKDGWRVVVRATEAEALGSKSPSLHNPTRTGVRWLEFDDLGQRVAEVIVIVPSRVRAGQFRTAVAHELGHHFDMNHTQATGGALMALNYGPLATVHVDAECLTAVDVAELCNSHACGHPRECAP